MFACCAAASGQEDVAVEAIPEKFDVDRTFSAMSPSPREGDVQGVGDSPQLSEEEHMVPTKSSGTSGDTHSSSAAFKDLLRQLEQEHAKELSQQRDNLLSELDRLRQENLRLRKEEESRRRSLSMSSEDDDVVDSTAAASGAGVLDVTPSFSTPTSSRQQRLGSTSKNWNPVLPPSRWSGTAPGDRVSTKSSDAAAFALAVSSAVLETTGEATKGNSSERAAMDRVGKRTSTRFAQEYVHSSGNGATGSKKLMAMELQADFGRVEMARLLGHHTAPQRCMISPVSRLRLCWDFVAFTCLLVDLWITPLELVFMHESNVPAWFGVFNWAITAFFVVDIGLNFSTGYIDRDKLVMQRRACIKKYLCFWFWIDILATIPFDILVAAILRANFEGDMFSVARLARLTKVTKVLKTLRFLKMLRAIRLVQSMGHTHTFVDMFEPMKYVIRLGQLLTSLAFIAHLHGCIWALLQPEMVNNEDIAEAFYKYYQSFRWAYNAIAVGEVVSDQEPENTGVWTLEMVIASERILMALLVGGWSLVKALTMFQEDAQLTLVKNAAVRFFRQHEVSIETQISVMYSLHETRAAQKMQRHFKSLMQEHLPDELRRTVSEELWVPHLVTLGLIAHMKNWHEDFLVELALIVREEVVASKTILCREGHASIAAYHILKGTLLVSSSHFHGMVPSFTDGMWVEETALISPTRRRTSTVLTPILSRLMSVPTQAFHELVANLGLDTKFQEFRDVTLARGLCGRCGDVGDHFTHACPLAGFQRVGRPRRSSTSVKGRRRRKGRLPTWQRSDQEVSSNLSLSAFLHAHRLNGLHPLLQEQQIHDRRDLENLDFEGLRRDLESQGEEEVKRQLSLLHALVLEQQEQAAFENQDEMVSAQHLAFLSHYKMESGTEAALMRAELERVLIEESASPAHLFNVPIFLDTEDLSDLDDLQEHVRRSHNLVLLLTKDVLMRPWVLVEIVTAIKEDVRVLPVEVSKKGSAFNFPDEVYYARLVAGQVLDADSQALLHDRGIELRDVERALREVFMRIALPYSPHRAESIRKAEIQAIYKQCMLKTNNLPVERVGTSRPATPSAAL